MKNKQKKEKRKKIYVIILPFLILLEIIMSLLFSTENNYFELKYTLMMILFNILICCLLAVSLYKVEKSNKPIWIVFLIINFIAMFVTKYEYGITFIKFINGITFGIYQLSVTYYLCSKFIFKGKNKFNRNIMLVFSVIIILVNLILPTHINKFLALNIFKNKNFESQKFYCNIVDNYNLYHKKQFPYIYKLSNDQLNDISSVEIYPDKGSYEFTGLSLNDIRKNDLKKVKQNYNKKYIESESTGYIDYRFNWFSKNSFVINSPNVKFIMYYEFYNCHFNTLDIIYSDIKFINLYFNNTQVKKIALNNNYLDFSKLGNNRLPYFKGDSVMIKPNKKVSDIKFNGLNVVVSDKNGYIKNSDNTIMNNDIISIKDSNGEKLFTWKVEISQIE